VQVTHPTTIRRSDLAIGLTKPTALAAARRVMFALSPVLPSRGDVVPTPDAASPEVA
jgi:hypothetical protein